MPTQVEQGTVTLTHPKGSRVEILLYGATVISWIAPSPSGSLQERLFVSSKALLDGSKPVRGGIPVVFPCFGAPTHPEHLKLAQHGFARNTIWKFAGVVMDNEAGVSVKLTLDPIDHESISSVYPKKFALSYVVTLAEHQLSTDLHVENTSPSDSLEFQALLHNYISSPADEVSISPLQGLSFYDKTEPTEEGKAKAKVESRDKVDVKKFTDSVYENAPGRYNIVWPQGSIEIKAKGFKDVVVWNPQEEGAKIGDMETQGWKKYVCVEPGYVRGFVKLEPQQKWTGQQVLTIQSLTHL
ncbi:hypothetical protein D9613_001839 [Agrocybe pediades]|uniref:Glucose-6-phosphate 1-epimerase n=1 Tax=Agrocybe pediades TaxID=84607 RepID=A0A8H4R4Q3_9AGAR|nr:hypothetical protein D9613_001839 [Agrocybe pediades]